MDGGPPGAAAHPATAERKSPPKDELVTALTVQMEQLAEQLDRCSAPAPTANAVAELCRPEFIEGHKKIVGDLERIVQQWEDMQAGMMLGRIEVQFRN